MMRRISDNLRPTTAQKEALLWLRGVGPIFLTKDMLPPEMCPFEARAFVALELLGLVEIRGRLVEITKAGGAFNLDGVSMTGATV